MLHPNANALHPILVHTPRRTQKKPAVSGGLLSLSGQRPTLPRTSARSTIGAEGLNFRVRDGNGCLPLATVTRKTVKNLNIDGQRNLAPLCVSGKFYGQAERAISSGELNPLPDLHIRPINLVVFQGPSYPRGLGDLILGRASRLYAFSAYPVRT